MQWKIIALIFEWRTDTHDYRFLYRVATSWDYGWQQKKAKQRARDVNFGRSFILRHTFYRKNNLAPDPPHYAQPAGGQVSICSEYACTNYQ